MTPSTLLLRSRGWAWQLSVSVLSVAGLAILSGMSGFGAQLVLGMTAEDAWLWSSSLGSLATSGILASLATSEAALYEVTRSRALWRQRILLFLACLLFLGWPVLGVLLGWQPYVALQILAVGWGMFGASAIIAPLWPRGYAAPQLAALLLSVIPLFLPRQWNALMPTQRGTPFLVTMVVLVVLGCVAHAATSPRLLPPTEED